MISSEVRRWRVRGWIRGASSAAVLILLWQQFSTITMVNQGDMPPSEVSLGWTFIALLTMAVVLLAFRPYIELRSSGLVVVQGPVMRRTFGLWDG